MAGALRGSGNDESSSISGRGALAVSVLGIRIHILSNKIPSYLRTLSAYKHE